VARQVQKGIDLGNGHALWSIGNLQNFVARCDLAFLEYAQIEARTTIRNQQGGHPRLIHSNADAVASHARLCYFKQCTADSIAVAYAHLIVIQALNGKIFAELAEGEIVAAKMILPVPVGIDLIYQDRAVLAPMSGEIALAIALDVESPDKAAALNRIFPDARMHCLAVPRNVARKTNIH
jgi:hypothetical protein